MNHPYIKKFRRSERSKCQKKIHEATARIAANDGGTSGQKRVGGIGK
jgi:hypothetical protein